MLLGLAQRRGGDEKLFGPWSSGDEECGDKMVWRLVVGEPVGEVRHGGDGCVVDVWSFWWMTMVEVISGGIAGSSRRGRRRRPEKVREEEERISVVYSG
ncbi:hypothetical protein Tco_0190011 [Tanacetum coccineum]